MILKPRTSRSLVIRLGKLQCRVCWLGWDSWVVTKKQQPGGWKKLWKKPFVGPATEGRSWTGSQEERCNDFATTADPPAGESNLKAKHLLKRRKQSTPGQSYNQTKIHLSHPLNPRNWRLLKNWSERSNSQIRLLSLIFKIVLTSPSVTEKLTVLNKTLH